MITLLLACTTLDVGEWGTFRYFADLKGEPSMRLIPPYSDRNGNVYVLYGDREEPETEIYAGAATGGWNGPCEAVTGGDGVRGFVGRSDDKVWYWVGDTLARVYGTSATCTRVLDTHPQTKTDLQFLGVAPQAASSPSGTDIVVLVKGVTDRVPYYEVIDLEREELVHERIFSPDTASDIKVLGTGGDAYRRQFHFLVQYTTGAGTTTEVQVIDEDGVEVKTIPITMGAADELSLLGFLRIDASGNGAGLFDDDSIIAYNDGAGTTVEVANFTPYGVQLFDDSLYVVGLSGNQPVTATVSGGQVGQPKTWEAPLAAVGKLNRVTVVNERSGQNNTDVWSNARSAFGPAPFLSPYPLDDYAPGVTTWLVAGPGYTVSGSDEYTSVALAPVGIGSP